MKLPKCSWRLVFACLFLTTTAAPASAASRTLKAGDVLPVSEDFVLSGDDVLEIIGTPENRCRIDANGQTIRTNGKWTGRIKIVHCDFRGLGSATKPALDITAGGDGNQIVIEHGDFHGSGAVHFVNAGQSATVFRNNRIRESSMVPVTNLPDKSSPCFRASGDSPARKFFQGNRIEKSILLFERARNWLIGGDSDADSNIITGLRGSLSLYTCDDLTVRGNYIHTEIPSFRWSQVHTIAVLSPCPNLVIEHNIIRHGQWVVRGLTGEFRYNLVLDADGHQFIIGPRAHTHIHHNIFARYCTVDPNLNSSIGVIYKGDDIQIYNNTFDAGGKDLARPWSVPAIEVGGEAFLQSLRSNAFVNHTTKGAIVRGGIQEKGDGAAARLGSADYNLFNNPDSAKHNYGLGVPNKTERTDAGFARHDVPVDGAKNAQAEPKFAGPIPKTFTYSDDDLRAGKVTVSQILAAYRAAYSPAEGSPLAGGGDPADGKGNFIGAVGAGKDAPNDRFGRFGAPSQAAEVQPGPVAANVAPRLSWDGIIEDENLLKEKPVNGFVADENAWAKLWKAWRGPEAMGRVDFAKELVLVFTFEGPNKISPPEIRLNSAADLQARTVATLIAAKGFCYKFVVISREGVKSVNGKALPAVVPAPPAAGIHFPPTPNLPLRTGETPKLTRELDPILKDLGVTLRVTERPKPAKFTAASVAVTLIPQTDNPGTQIVSFGLPFPPDALREDKLIRVTGADGAEIATITKPLAHWGIDGKPGALRSVLIQFEMKFADRAPQKVTVSWDKERQSKRDALTPIADTQVTKNTDGFDFHSPRVLAVLPPDWLCASLVAWQQVPVSENKAAPWFDQHLVAQFPGSVKNIATKSVEAHLYDRPATYAKIYVRHGEEKYLLAALQSNDFYLQNLGEDGFFKLKPGDFKYVYAEGSTIMYLLTGDERYKACVERGLRSWARWTRLEYKGQGFWTERHAGTGMAAYLHAYELSGDAKHLEMAKKFFDGVFAIQVKPADGKAPDGAWVHTSDSHGDGNGWTTSPWMSTLLMDSIWKLWLLTGEPRCPASLALYAKFTARHAITPDGKGVFYMANSPGRGKSEDPESPPHNMEACYNLALGYYLSGGTDESLRNTINTLWPPLLKDGANAPGRKFNWRFRETSMLIWFLQNATAEAQRQGLAPLPPARGQYIGLKEVNPPADVEATKVVAITGATLIDGRGGRVIPDSVVVVRGSKIVAAGPRMRTQVPPGAEVIDARGLSVVPGLLDAHFHIESWLDLPHTFLTHGVTGVRDPGEWFKKWEPAIKGEQSMPRFFFTGPHLDQKPVAHPGSSFVVADAREAKDTVDRFVKEGASGIKIYFRIPEDVLKVVCDTAHGHGIPVTAHLEIFDADKAIRCGLDGVEHVTSFTTALADPTDAERFRADVTLDNAARGRGRNEIWSRIDVEKSPRVRAVIDLMAQRQTFLSPTLAVFELRRGDKNATEEKAKGYENQLKFVGLCHKAGVPIVAGSHSSVPKSPKADGWAYQRELELLVEAGLTPLETITAATLNNARFFGASDRIGTIEPGKQADLVLVDGDPSKDIKQMRQIKRVMLNGRWVVSSEK